MDINIQTKFNIGDKVWVPGLYYEWYPMKNRYFITHIDIEIDSNDYQIFYIMKNENNSGQRYPDRLCFDSYDECEQWCMENNKRR